MRIEDLSPDKIKVSYNPRKFFDPKMMEELKASVKSKGILVPLKVRPIKDDMYTHELVYGERRLKAAKELGLPTVPCLVDETVDSATAILQKGIENISRGNLHYLEQGAYFHKLLTEKIGGIETQDDVAKVFGISQTLISQLVKIWNYLYDESKEYILPALLMLNKDILITNNHLLVINISFAHALTLTKLHHQTLKVEEKVNQALPDSEELATAIIDEFTSKCKEFQLKLCRQTDEEHLSLAKLGRKVDSLVKEINDALENRVTEERSRACHVISHNGYNALFYNRDASLMLNDLDKDIQGVNILRRRFGLVPLIITSPPYFVGKDFDKESWEEHLDTLERVIEVCSDVLMPGGKFAINVADPVIENEKGKRVETLIIPHIAKFMEKSGLTLFARIIWHKGGYWANAGHAVDIQAPLTEYRVLFNWEYVFVFRKEGKRDIPSSIDISNRLCREDWERYVDAVWQIPSVRCNPTSKDAPFPEELPRRLIKMYSCDNDIVLDPFSGQGTVAKVALELNRNAVMYELDQDIWLQSIAT